ncbi:SPRY domain-containing protein [Apiospora aurea]|uniref:SPRY domain-containing protein n=1 Tax=Apiospora aurea TaxID=335848 RepID=A0ABR1PZ68_9PEZI
MSNPYAHGSAGLPLDASFTGYIPSMRSSYASITAATNPTSTPTSSTSQPRTNRLSHLLNPAHEMNSDLYSPRLSSMFQSHAMELERGSSTPDGDMSALGARVPQLPPFSRAFQKYMNGGTGDSLWASQYRPSAFFTPSYLKGSSYIQKLEEAHKAKQAQKEVQQQSGGGTHASQITPGSTHTKPVSHYGMTYDLIERAPLLEEDDSIAPLPTRWNRDDKHGGLEVMGDGQEVKYTGPKPVGEREHEACAIRADHPMPAEAGIYYFEVTILSRKRDDTTISVGFSHRPVSLARLPGWESDSYGYHGDDGHVYAGHQSGKVYGPTFGVGDTIGCGVNFKNGTAFFTKNGIHLGTACRDVKGTIYPAVGLKKQDEHIRVNFGHTPFNFDIDGLMQSERNKVKQEILGTSTDKLVSPPLSETDLIQRLVLQFLQHDGYVETARAFAEEIHGEKQALRLDPRTQVGGINVKDDEDATRRQRIRRAILGGDVDQALKYTKIYYPHVLEDNEQVNFRLRCCKFIEMVRKSAEFNNNNHSATNGSNSVIKKSNGRARMDDIPNEMDLDENGFSNDDTMETEEGMDADALLLDAVQYGKRLQAEFMSDPRKEIRKTLQDVFSLLAYQNPFQVKEVAHLLDKRNRVAVAEELNSAILMSLGKSSRSALENLYGQTSVLLDYLREDGGSGSFVTVQSVMDEIPKSQLF